MPVKAYVIFCRDLEVFVLYYVMGVSVPSLHRESTDSLMQKHEAFHLWTALCVVCVRGLSLDHRRSCKPAWLRLESVSDKVGRVPCAAPEVTKLMTSNKRGLKNVIIKLGVKYLSLTYLRLKSLQLLIMSFTEFQWSTY